MVSVGDSRRFWISLLAVVSVTATGCALPRIPGLSSGGTSSVTNPLVSRWRSRAPKTEKEKFTAATKGLKYPEQTHLAHARWQEQLGHLVEARNSYEIALSHNSKSVDAVIGLARLDQLSGRTNKAEQGYLKALKIHPHSPQALDALGQFYGSQDQWDKAAQILNSAMRAAPDETTYRYHLAVALSRSGRISESMPHFVKTIGEAEAHYNIGFILYEQGDLAGAKQQLTQAILKKPELTVAQQMLDEVIQDQNDKFLSSAPDSSITRQSALTQFPEAKRAKGPSTIQVPMAVSIGPSGQVTKSEWNPTLNRERSIASKPTLNAPAFPGNSAPDSSALQNHLAVPADESLTPEQLEQMKNQLNRQPGIGR